MEYSYIYTIGDKGYTKVNEKTGEVKQSKSLEDFSEDDQEIFRQLEQNEAGLEKWNKKEDLNFRSSFTFCETYSTSPELYGKI